MRELEFKARLGCRGGGGEGRGTGEFGGFTHSAIVEDDARGGGLEASLLNTSFTSLDGNAEVRGQESEGPLIMVRPAGTTDSEFQERNQQIQHREQQDVGPEHQDINSDTISSKTVPEGRKSDSLSPSSSSPTLSNGTEANTDIFDLIDFPSEEDIAEAVYEQRRCGNTNEEATFDDGGFEHVARDTFDRKSEMMERSAEDSGVVPQAEDTDTKVHSAVVLPDDDNWLRNYIFFCHNRRENDLFS